MSGRARPQVAVFDVVETLASLDPVTDRLAEHGLDRSVLAGWFTRLLPDAMALTAAGGYAGFAEVATSALHAETRGELSDVQLEHVVAGFGELTAQPDAVAAVRAAREAGLRVLTLSNGAAATTRGFLERAGIADEVEAVLSIDDVRAWKPAPVVYRHALAHAGVRAQDVALVAVHSWDLYGARHVGLTTGWCPRLERTPTPLFGNSRRRRRHPRCRDRRLGGVTRMRLNAPAGREHFRCRSRMARNRASGGVLRGTDAATGTWRGRPAASCKSTYPQALVGRGATIGVAGRVALPVRTIVPDANEGWLSPAGDSGLAAWTRITIFYATAPIVASAGYLTACRAQTEPARQDEG